MTARPKKKKRFFVGVKATKNTKEDDYYILFFSVIPHKTWITTTHWHKRECQAVTISTPDNL